MIRVLLADDHAIVIEGLRALLDGEPDIKVAAWTTDGTEVVRLVEQHKPDVVVLDLELTSIKGTEVIAALRERSTPPRVLVLTARSEEHTSELQSLRHLVCRLLLEKKKIR